MERRLHSAAEHGDHGAVVAILQNPGVRVNASDIFGRTALYHACEQSHPQIVETLVADGRVNIHTQDRLEGDFLLHVVCKNFLSSPKSIRMMAQALLRAGADPNAVDGHGQTPLHCAILQRICPAEVVEDLLNGGANPQVVDNDNVTPLHIACRSRSDDRLRIVTLIFRSWPQMQCLTAINTDNQTPIDCVPNGPDPSGELASVRAYLLHSYAGLVARSQGNRCLHLLLQSAKQFIASGEYQLPIGTLDTHLLQYLFACLIAAAPGSICFVNNGELPLQLAHRWGFPDVVLNVLLRSHPAVLPLLTQEPSDVVDVV